MAASFRRMPGATDVRFAADCMEVEMRAARTSAGNRAGIALATALGGIIVIGVMIGGVFFVSTQEARASGGSFAQERAFRAAELGLNQATGEWDNVAMGLLPVGSVTTRTYSGPGWVDTVHITKLGPYLYTAVSTATVNAGLLGKARRTTGLSLRTLSLDFGFESALTVRADARIGGSSFVSGVDWNPPTWGDCPAVSDTVAGLAVESESLVRWSGCPNQTCLEGLPRVLESPAAGDTTTYFTFGDMAWAELTSMATRVYTGAPTMNGMAPSVTPDGGCDFGNTSNWGAALRTTNPAHPCEGFIPIIHFKGPGTVSLSGGRGQGILLVDGNLEVSGGFEFYGPVIVRGSIRTVGQSGTRLIGAVMAANVDLAENLFLGDATVRYSNCTIERAKLAAATPRRVAQRAWTEAF